LNTTSPSVLQYNPIVQSRQECDASLNVEGENRNSKNTTGQHDHNTDRNVQPTWVTWKQKKLRDDSSIVAEMKQKDH